MPIPESWYRTLRYIQWVQRETFQDTPTPDPSRSSLEYVLLLKNLRIPPEHEEGRRLFHSLEYDLRQKAIDEALSGEVEVPPSDAQRIADEIHAAWPFISTQEAHDYYVSLGPEVNPSVKAVRMQLWVLREVLSRQAP